LLGGFRVSVGSRTITQDAWRLRKAAALVKLLALAPGHRLHREQIMHLLWPDSGRKAASNSLRKALHSARRTLDPTVGSFYLTSKDESLVLCPEGDLWVDVEAFEEGASTARRSRDPAAYRAALDLYAGELLPEDRYEEWAEDRREGLRHKWLSSHVGLARVYEGRGEHDKGIEVLRKVVAEEPTNEGAHVGLMRLYALSERKEEARGQYGRLEEALRKLGSQPAASSRALKEEIASGRYALQSVGDASMPADAPADDDKHNLPAPRNSFVGREQERIWVKRELAMTRLLTLTGPVGPARHALLWRWLVTLWEHMQTGCGSWSWPLSQIPGWCPRR
jgi:DNA-binding SARP family transcriptional activator